MNANPHQRRALVTGGAGLIGSHVADLLLLEGWKVRILDNLEPQTHRNGKPPWVPQACGIRGRKYSGPRHDHRGITGY